MSKVVSSPDISVIDFDILIDISGATPSAKFTQQSTQINAANLEWIFQLLSPSGTIIYEGNFAAPDQNPWADGTDFDVTTGFPNPFNQIEWSGNPYLAKVQVKDINSNIFEYEKSVGVCRPTGNTNKSKNSFGSTNVEIQTLCSRGQIWAEDKTNYSYKGITGVMVSKEFKLLYPEDNTGTAPAPQVVTNFSSVLLPISQSGSGYRYFVSSIFDYDLGNRITVRVKYLQRGEITAYCHLDITPVACEIQKLQDSVTNGTCENAAEAQNLLNIITPKLLTAMIGVQYPQSGIDPFAVIEDINKITGWECDCCPNGIVPLASIASNGLAFDVNASNDITGQFDIVGDTVTLTIKDKTYSFLLKPGITSTAYAITSVSDANSKTFYFNVDRDILAGEILTTIGGDNALIQQLNDLIFLGSGDWNLNVDMKCIGSAKLCDFSFTTKNLTGIPKILITRLAYSNDLLTQRVVLNFAFDKTNTQDLEDLLNTLNIGVFVCAFAAEVLTITCDNCPVDILSINYSTLTDDNSYDMIMSKDCTGVINVPANTVIQKIIDFLCAIILGRILTGKGYSVSQLDKVGGDITEVIISSQDSASKLMDAIVAEHNKLVDLIKNVNDVDCDSITEIYASPVDEMSQNDLIHGSIAGQCAKITPEELAIAIFKMAQTTQSVKDIFCKAVSNCASPICVPVSNVDVVFNSGASTLTADITNVGALKYRVGYRLVGNGPLKEVVEVTATVGATTQKVWTSIGAGNYEVVVVSICSSGESSPFTALANQCEVPDSFNVTFDNDTQLFTVDFATPVAITKVKLDIIYPNGGTASSIHLVSGGSFTKTRPSSLSGIYTFLLRSVCDEAAAWYSEPLTAVSIKVAEVTSCPSVFEATITNIGQNSVTISANKPTGLNIGGYKLRLTNQSNSAVSEYHSNTPGSAVTWAVSGLVAGTEYAAEIITLCKSFSSDSESESLAVPLSNFITHSGAANNSSQTNNSPVDLINYIIKVNGIILHTGSLLSNTGGVTNFITGNYSLATVTLLFTSANGYSGHVSQLTSNAIVYNPTTYAGKIEYNNVDIVNGMAITVSDAP